MSLSHVLQSRIRRPISYVTGSRRWKTTNQKSGVTETLQHKGVDTVTDSFLSTMGMHIVMSIWKLKTSTKPTEPATKKYDIDKQQHELLGDTVTGVRRAPETISYFRNPTIR